MFFHESARIDGRRFFVMERLAGRALMGGIRVRELGGSGLRLFRQLPDVTASVQASLHRLDARPLVEAMGATAGIERWFDALSAQIDAGADGFRGGLDWLVEHRPRTGARMSICHGDLWGGNILVEDGNVSGILDWTTVTVAEPVLDVGFTAMGLSLAPIDARHGPSNVSPHGWVA